MTWTIIIVFVCMNLSKIGFSQQVKNKNDFEPIYLLSYSYRGLGDYDKALITLNRAENLLLANSYELSKVFISKGSLYLLSGNYTEAEKFYKRKNKF